MPAATEFNYTIENLFLVMEKLIAMLGISRYVLYVHDYGGPEAVINEKGLGEPFDLFLKHFGRTAIQQPRRICRVSNV